jgi:Mg2+-importing ATPase
LEVNVSSQIRVDVIEPAGLAGSPRQGASVKAGGSGVLAADRQVRIAASRQALLDMARLSPDEALARLGSGSSGLEGEASRQRLLRWGPNLASHRPEPGWAVQLLRRLINPLHGLLLVLAGLSVLTGNVESAAVIASMVVLSLTLSIIQERRSGRAAAALKAMVHTTASVLRPGAATHTTVPIELLVPGDVLHLSAGDLVPADVRLLQARDCFVNEAALTGESVPVEKHAQPESDEAIQAGDELALRNLAFMGTHVASGTAMALVVNTGSRAVFGGIAESLEGVRGATSFEQGVQRYTWLMLTFIAVMVPLVFFINGFSKGNWFEAFLFALAVAVGLTPEMLPMLVTVNLAKGALAMSRRRVIVKRLPAIQDFGAMDVLCTDKTGTLTQDRVILQRHIDLDGQASDRVLDFAYLNSCYQSGLKSQLDEAVLRHAEVHHKLHAQGAWQKVDEIPFDFQRRRMSVVVACPGQRELICKGAVEEVFAVCSHAELGGEVVQLDDSHLVRVQDTSRALNEDGFRVIAIAHKPIDPAQPPLTVADESGLVLLGFVAFLDPPKDGAREALAALNRHGVTVKVLTGDNDIVTAKVCRDVGLDVERVVLGREIECMDDASLAQEVSRHSVFAKLSPAQKARIISSLRAQGHVVGYLGDGINDGPAMQAADVGVSVDTAVDIAKESADIILLDKSLMVLDEGVTEGRRVFANVMKYLRMGASSNFGNMLSVLGASAWLPFVPMAPIQVLTNNLMYDFSQAAIATDDVDEEELQRPRRWEVPNIARTMLLIGPISSVFDYLTFAVLHWVFLARQPSDAALFQTGWFLESLLSQALVVHVLRTGRLPFVQSQASLWVRVTSVAVCVLALWLPFSPLAPALGLVTMPSGWWPWLLGILLSYLLTTFLLTRAMRRRGWLD